MMSAWDGRKQMIPLCDSWQALVRRTHVHWPAVAYTHASGGSAAPCCIRQQRRKLRAPTCKEEQVEEDDGDGKASFYGAAVDMGGVGGSIGFENE